MNRIFQHELKKQAFDAAILTSLEGGKLILSLERMGQRMTVFNQNGVMTFNHLQEARELLKKVKCDNLFFESQSAYDELDNDHTYLPSERAEKVPVQCSPNP